MRLRSALVLVLALACSMLTFGQQQNEVRATPLRGSVVDAYGRPIPSALVQISPLNGGAAQTVMTDGAGEFNCEVIGSGPYLATVTTGQATQQFMLENPVLQEVTLQMQGAFTPAAEKAVTPTVSVNDLEAPSKAKSKLASASKAVKKSDLAKAWRLVNDAIRIAPSWGRAYLLRGVLNFSNHDYVSARSDFATAIAHNPHDAMALTEMGKLYTTTGNYRLSRDYLERALRETPVLWPTYLELARLDVLEHNFAEADAMATRAMQCHPPAPASIHYIDAIAVYFLHHYRRAATQFKLFLAGAPKTADFAASRATAERDLQLLAKRKQ